MADKDVRFEIIRDDGEVFVIDDVMWRIPENGLSGWHTLNVDIASLDNVLRDGGVITSQRVGMVDRSITAEVRYAKANSIARRQAERFFLPKRTYTVYATYMGRTRTCEGVQAGFKLTEGNVYDPLQLAWTIFCADPYMKATETVTDTRKIAPKSGSGMPYLVSGKVYANSSPKINDGFVTGIGQGFDTTQEIDQSMVYFIDNIGDVPTAPRIEIDMNHSSGLYIDLDVYLVECNMSTNGKYYLSRTDRKLKLQGIYWSVPSGAMFWDNPPMIIDLNSRPFRVLSGEKSESFTLADDSLLRDPFISSGLWAIELSVRRSGYSGTYDGFNKASIEIQPKYTGV